MQPPAQVTAAAPRRTIVRPRSEFPVSPGGMRSVVEGLAWPGLPPGNHLAQLALQFQLEQTQWWPPERLLACQLEQLEVLLRHAGATISGIGAT